MKKLKIFLGVVVLVLAGMLILSKHRQPAEIHTDYGAVGDFSFTDQSGKTLSLTDLKGKTWIADFFFTQCMGPCPLLTARMAELQKQTAGKKDMVFVSFSVDPDHDTPVVLTHYAKTYTSDLSNWYFLTGSKEKLYKLIRESFHLAVEQKPPEKPSLNDILHSTYFVLVGPDGHVRGYFNTDDLDAMKKLHTELGLN